RYIPRFLYYVLCSSVFRAHIDVHQSGTTFSGVTQEAIAKFPLILPPVAEQCSIVAFLDREIGAIDTAVTQQERLIELLTEKRQAIISHAVTKGLNPKVPLKPSGIEWIGDVPAHWKVIPFRRLTTRVDVGIAEAATHAYVEQGVPIVRSTNIKHQFVDTD